MTIACMLLGVASQLLALAPAHVTAGRIDSPAYLERAAEHAYLTGEVVDPMASSRRLAWRFHLVGAGLLLTAAAGAPGALVAGLVAALGYYTWCLVRTRANLVAIVGA